MSSAPKVFGAGTQPAHPTPSRRRAGDRTAEFEALLLDSGKPSRYELLLYVAGTGPRSSAAIASIRSLCEEFLTDLYDLQVIDIYQQPAEATERQIIAAPTLIRLFPLPHRRLIGDLSNRLKVIAGLNLLPRVLSDTTTAA